MKKTPFNNENLEICTVGCHWGILGEITKFVGYLTQRAVAHNYGYSQAANYPNALQIKETPGVVGATPGVGNQDVRLEADLHGFVGAGRYAQLTGYALIMIKRDMHLLSVN